MIPVYAPKSAHHDNEVEEFYHLLQANIDRIDKKDILIILGDCNGKVGNLLMHGKTGTHYVGHLVMPSPTNEA